MRCDCERSPWIMAAVNPSRLRFPRQTLGSALGVRENQEPPGFLGQQSLQHFLFAVGGHFECLE